MADEATPTAQAAPVEGEKPTTRTYTQSDLDNITAKVKETTAKQVREEIAAQLEREKMSELDRLKAERDAEKAARESAERERQTLTRKFGVVTAASSIGYVPEEYLERALASAAEGDAPEAIAKAAHEKFVADASKLSTKPPAPSPTQRGGTAPSSPTDYDNMTDEQLAKLAVTMSKKDYEEKLKPVWDRKRKAAAGRA